MDEGRNVCLLFPESIEFGKDEEDFERFRDCFQVSCVFFPGLDFGMGDGLTGVWRWAGRISFTVNGW